MRTFIVLAVLLMAGCTSPLHDRLDESEAFHVTGLFDAASKSGDIDEAMRDYDGGHYPHLDPGFELDEWGPERAKINSIVWYGPEGEPGIGQGFRIDGYQTQGYFDGITTQRARELYDEFLQYVTDLDADERQEATDALFANCHFACTTPVDKENGGKAIRRLGGLAAADTSGLTPHGGYLVFGQWKIEVRVDTVYLESGQGPGRVSMWVGAHDIATFRWVSGSNKSDAECNERLRDYLADMGLEAPKVTWTHGEVEYD